MTCVFLRTRALANSGPMQEDASVLNETHADIIPSAARAAADVNEVCHPSSIRPYLLTRIAEIELGHPDCGAYHVG